MKVVHTPRSIVVSKNEFELKYIEAANENDVLRARIEALEKELNRRAEIVKAKENEKIIIFVNR